MIPDGALGLVRRAIQESHGQEKQFRDAAITALRWRQDEIFAKDQPGQKMRVLRVVASDATLEGRKARLHLRPAFSLLAKSRSHQNWLPFIKDLRTALIKDPLQLETVRELMGGVGA